MCLMQQQTYFVCIIRGEPERVPNTRETGSGIYIYLFILHYLLVHDLAWQRPNVHAQSLRVRM